MKRMLSLCLVFLLLLGCAAPAASDSPASAAAGSTAPVQTTREPTPVTSEAAPLAPETDTPETEALVSASEIALGEGEILLYRQENFKARRGSLLKQEALLGAPAEALMPRAHCYDVLFEGEAQRWLQLLDYALANEYQGFAVVSGLLPELDVTQRLALEYIYRIDGGKVLSIDRDGLTTVWYECAKNDTMEKFALGLAAARRIAAEAPQGSEYERTVWVFDYLAEHVVYGDRDTYYFRRGHQLCDALVDHECVCSGYADAMYFLCNLLGVECLVSIGQANSLDKPSGLDDHAWNQVRLDGQWYLFDPTMNAVSKASGIRLAFGLSDEVLYLIGGNKRAYHYDNKELVPVCDRCFDPVAAWNGSPEGALRSWLWYAELAEKMPSYLPLCSNLVTLDTEFGTPDAEGVTVTGLPYDAFRGWTLRFMSEECAARFFPDPYGESADSTLTIRMTPAEDGIDWDALEAGEVLANADGSYEAELGAMRAVFTVSKTDEGLYRIESLELQPLHRKQPT